MFKLVVTEAVPPLYEVERGQGVRSYYWIGSSWLLR
jgi:hypothetical protein